MMSYDKGINLTSRYESKILMKQLRKVMVNFFENSPVVNFLPFNTLFNFELIYKSELTNFIFNLR